MDEIDRKILEEIKNGIEISDEPFNEIASRLAIPHQEVIARLNVMRKEGVIRKFGVSLKPNNIGFSANALVAWKVPASRIQVVGGYLSKLPEISHCYERKPVEGRWEYNLYTVMHARERESIQCMVNQISHELEMNDFKILFSTRDLKRGIARDKSVTSLPESMQEAGSV